MKGTKGTINFPLMKNNQYQLLIPFRNLKSHFDHLNHLFEKKSKLLTYKALIRPNICLNRLKHFRLLQKKKNMTNKYNLTA